MICDHLPDLLITSDEGVECPSCGMRWVASAVCDRAYKDGYNTGRMHSLAERDRYREALERIERVCGWDDHDGNAAVEIAREALRIGPRCACGFGPDEFRGP